MGSPPVRQKGYSFCRVKPNGLLPPPENPRAAPLICRLPLKGGVIDGEGAGRSSCMMGTLAPGRMPGRP